MGAPLLPSELAGGREGGTATERRERGRGPRAGGRGREVETERWRERGRERGGERDGVGGREKEGDLV